MKGSFKKKGERDVNRVELLKPTVGGLSTHALNGDDRTRAHRMPHDAAQCRTISHHMQHNSRPQSIPGFRVSG